MLISKTVFERYSELPFDSATEIDVERVYNAIRADEHLADYPSALIEYIAHAYGVSKEFGDKQVFRLRMYMRNMQRGTLDPERVLQVCAESAIRSILRKAEQKEDMSDYRFFFNIYRHRASNVITV